MLQDIYYILSCRLRTIIYLIILFIAVKIFEKLNDHVITSLLIYNQNPKVLHTDVEA